MILKVSFSDGRVVCLKTKFSGIRVADDREADPIHDSSGVD